MRIAPTSSRVCIMATQATNRQLQCYVGAVTAKTPTRAFGVALPFSHEETAVFSISKCCIT